MFQREFVALGENQTRGWLQLCLDPPLDPPQIPHRSPTDPAQRVRNDASLTTGETTCDSKGGIIIACDLEGLIVRQFLFIHWDNQESPLFILISSLHINRT